MATPNVPTVEPIVADKLRDQIQFMDALSQEGCSQITAIARLSLLAMESHRKLPNPEDLASAFLAIRNLADNLENNISNEAREVGCDFTDHDINARIYAREAQRCRDLSQVRVKA